MEVSFDGLRTKATRSMNELHDVLKDIIEKYKDDFYYNEDEDIIETFNEAAQFVDIFNCLFDDNIDDDMNKLDISVDRLKEEKE